MLNVFTKTKHLEKTVRKITVTGYDTRTEDKISQNTEHTYLVPTPYKESRREKVIVEYK